MIVEPNSEPGFAEIAQTGQRARIAGQRRIRSRSGAFRMLRKIFEQPLVYMSATVATCYFLFGAPH